MKRFVFVFPFILFSLLSFGQINPVEGKTYKGIITQACKSFKDGGCLITTYHILTFERDSVFVNYIVDPDCDVPKQNSTYERKGHIGAYSYQVQKKLNSPNHIIRVNGYEIGSFETSSNNLVEFINDPNYPKDLRKIFELSDNF